MTLTPTDKQRRQEEAARYRERIRAELAVLVAARKLCSCHDPTGVRWEDLRALRRAVAELPKEMPA